MKPVVSPAQDSLELSDEVLALHAWRMPDMVLYQHAYEEWWLAPLEDTVPLVKINRAGLNLLNAMNGKVTVAVLLEKFGPRVCGPNGETGRQCLERWPVPKYSLCYFGTEPPAGDRGDARWHLLLLKIREGWQGTSEFEGETRLSDFHTHEIASPESHFETIETTVSHLFREPSEAMGGLTYGRLLAKQLKKHGWWDRKPRVILEVGGGLGYVARDLGGGLSSEERQGVRYVFVDITRPFVKSQLAVGREGGWAAAGLQAHTEHEVQYSHLRQVAPFLGFQEKFGALPLFLNMRPDTRVLCTGAAYAIRRFCEAAGRSFAIRAYTESEFRHALGDMLPKLSGHHFHDISDPAWFGLWDFKVLLLEKPTAAPGPSPVIKDVKGFRWGGMR